MPERGSPKQRIMNWIGNMGGLSVHQQMRKFFEEVKEVHQPLLSVKSVYELEHLKEVNPKLAEHLAEELVDVGIVAVGIVGVLGYDFDDMAHRKLDRTEQKYHPQRVRELVEQGYSMQEAFDLLKQEFNIKNSL